MSETATERLTQRSVRTFVLRQGRMTPSQKEALATLYPRWGIPWQPDVLLDYAALFGRQAPVVLEIGSGMGDTTAAIAEANPDIDFIAVEVHGPGVGHLLKLIDTRRLTNLRVLRHDAIEVLERVIPPASLSAIHLFFPDPWPKKQHHKRRIVQPPLVALMASRLKPGGYLHCATDWEEYAQWMLEVLSAEPLLANDYPEHGFATPRPPWRPRTKFEQRGVALGHGVWDLIFRRRPAGTEPADMPLPAPTAPVPNPVSAGLPATDQPVADPPAPGAPEPNPARAPAPPSDQPAP